MMRLAICCIALTRAPNALLGSGRTMPYRGPISSRMRLLPRRLSDAMMARTWLSIDVSLATGVDARLGLVLLRTGLAGALDLGMVQSRESQVLDPVTDD